MTRLDWRSILLRRLGWSLGAASVWVWGLLVLRMLRDGLQPLEVWFGYGLSFLMTTVYVYLGLLIYSTWRSERSGQVDAPDDPASPHRASGVQRARRPLAALGVVGLLLALGSIAGWLTLRYPGPQAVPGTYASIVLVAMILGVAVISTLIARGARR